MNNKPLVSVLMNCFNGEQYLQEAIDSVMDQTYENWELIFWDNQSSDNSRKIVSMYNDVRIRYFYSDNHTRLYKARNSALVHCKGEVVAFLDCDDVWISSKLEIQMSEYNKGYGFIYTSFCTINSKGVKLTEYLCNNKSYIKPSSLLKKNCISISSVLISSELMNSNKFDVRYNLIGDFDLWLRLSDSTKLICLKAVLQLSRIHDGSTSNKHKDLWFKERRMLYEKLFQIINKDNYIQVFWYVIRNEFKFILSKLVVFRSG